MTLARRFLFHGYRASAARRTLRSIPKLTYVDFEFIDRSAQRVAVHTQFAGSAALIPLVFLKHGEDESLLELAHALGVEDVAFVHLQDECFQLIFHSRFLSSLDLWF